LVLEHNNKKTVEKQGFFALFRHFFCIFFALFVDILYLVHNRFFNHKAKKQSIKCAFVQSMLYLIMHGCAYIFLPLSTCFFDAGHPVWQKPSVTQAVRVAFIGAILNRAKLLFYRLYIIKRPLSNHSVAIRLTALDPFFKWCNNTEVDIHGLKASALAA